MKTVNFKNSVIALAIGLFAVSCGCGGSKQQSESATSDKTQIESKAEDKGNKSYEFPDIPVLNEWATADIWKAMGLPEDLKPATPENVNISFRNSIYPLNGEDGLMFECNAENDAFNNMANLLWERGYRGLKVDNDNIVEAQNKNEILIKNVDEFFYRSFYQYNGELMKIELHKTPTGKISLTVIYRPNK